MSRSVAIAYLCPAYIYVTVITKTLKIYKKVNGAFYVKVYDFGYFSYYTCLSDSRILRLTCWQCSHNPKMLISYLLI